MLKKDLTLPGSRVIVNPVIKSGFTVVKGESQVIEYMTMTESAGSVMDGRHRINSGEILTVVDKPKRRRAGINTAIVRTSNGIEGHVFWCELRASCNHYA